MVDFSHEYAKAFFLKPDEENKKDAVCMLIHGFTGSPSHLRPIGKSLRDAGYAVLGILLPGHGSSVEEMEKTTWADWLRAARDAAIGLRSEYERVYVGGLSMGGTLSLILAAEGLSDCCITFAAPILIRNVFSPLSRYVWPVYRRAKWGANTTKGFMTEYDYSYTHAPVRKVTDLRLLVRRSRMELGRVNCPAFIVQSKLDETVRPQSGQIIFDNIASVKKELLWLEQSGHVCTIGPETGLVSDKLIAFLRETDGLYDEMEIRL